MRDGSSQSGQEVPLALLVVFPLDEHRLYASTQQVGAWTNEAGRDTDQELSSNVSRLEQIKRTQLATFWGEAE